MEPPAVRRRWWRRPRLSVRSLMVLVLIVGAPFGWFVQRAAVQRNAVRAIEAAGGTVRYDFMEIGSFPGRPAKPLGPRWLVPYVGVDFLSNVTGVRFRPARKNPAVFSPDRSDAILAAVGRLPRLEQLVAPPLQATDAGMAHLAGLTRLRTLGIRGTPRLTDAGLARLAGMEQLETLTIEGTTSVEGPGIARLANLKRLRSLEIYVKAHEGLEGLAQLTGLERLDLEMANVSGEASAKLARLAWLKELVLGGDAGSSAGLARLETMAALEEIQIYGPWITDAGLLPFPKLKRLKRFGVADSAGVTPGGLYRLQTLRPDLRVGVNGTGRVPRERTNLLRRSTGPNAAPPAPGGP